MKKNHSLFYISAGLILVLAIILVRSGWNTNTQILQNSTTDSENVKLENLNHSTNSFSAKDYLKENIKSDSNEEIIEEYIDQVLLESSTAEDFQKLKSICSDQNSVIANYCDIYIHLKAKDWESFDASLESFVKLRPEEAFQHFALLEALEEAKNENPNPVYLNLLADIYLHETGNPAIFMKGITSLLEVIKLDSNNEMALYKLGMFAIQSNQLEKAKQRFKKLLSLQPENEEFRRLLLELCEKTGDADCLPEK